MNWSRHLPNQLPTPKQYLLAGLPTPSFPNGLASHFVQTVDEVDLGSLTHPRPEKTVSRSLQDGPRTITVVDSERQPIAVIQQSSNQFLSHIIDDDALPYETISLGILPSGLTHIRRATEPTKYEGSPRADAIDIDDARIATIDHSVLLSGLDRAKFAKNDALFVSVALEIEISASAFERTEDNGRVSRGLHFGRWEGTTAVAVDQLVFDVYRRLLSAASPPLTRPGALLSRTDLLCAATAIAYKSPMYTTKPKAYEGLKNGLRVLEYGPVRNESAVRVAINVPKPMVEPKSPEVQSTSTEPWSAVTTLAQAYERGDDVTEATDQLLKAAILEGTGLAKFTAHVLDDSNNHDVTWRLALLRRAVELAPAILSSSDEGLRERALRGAHEFIIDEWLELSPQQQIESDLAFSAIGHWGIWPDDASEDIFFDLSDDPTDPRVDTWYRAYLMMAGLDSAAIDKEIEAVHAGASVPSHDRVEELRGRS